MPKEEIATLYVWLFPDSVPRAGIEPARIAPLVFETNASTNSAIWASIESSPRTTCGF